jgi:hypothetical protein
MIASRYQKLLGFAHVHPQSITARNVSGNSNHHHPSLLKMALQSSDSMEVKPLLIAVGVGAVLGIGTLIHTLKAPEVLLTADRKNSIFPVEVKKMEKYSFHKFRRWLDSNEKVQDVLNMHPRTHSIPEQLQKSEATTIANSL